MKIQNLTILLILLSLGIFDRVFAQGKVTIEIHQDKGKIVEHTILPGQTLYGIARYYGTSVQAIRHYNQRITNAADMRFEKIFVPLKEENILYRVPLFISRSKLVPVYYKAKKKETVYRISSVYFKMGQDLLERRNNLRTDRIKEGQLLFVGWIKSSDDDLYISEGKMMKDFADSNRDKKDETDLAELFSLQIDNGNVIEKKTIALFDKNNSSSGMFVMHKFAKPGSIIEVENPMFGVSVYGKVLGKLPDNLYEKEIDMVISNEMANKLGVLDKRVFLNTRFIKNELGS